MYTLQDMPINERPRERLIQKGANSLADYELLAIILRTGNTEVSVLELAKQIIITLGNLGAFNNVTFQELKKYKGVKKAKAVEILAAIEFGKRVCQFDNIKQTINCAKDLYNYLRYEMENLLTEQVRVVYLNKKSEIMEIKTLSLGTVDNTTIDEREIIKWALKLSSNNFIICHNHPSGDPTPSLNDRLVTNELVSLAQKMGIQLIDHIIIGKNKYYSFQEHK